MVAFFWDKELTISERSVTPSAVIHNASLILGKQIINILPEGSVVILPSH
jgi:nucleoporin POM152